MTCALAIPGLLQEFVCNRTDCTELFEYPCYPALLRQPNRVRGSRAARSAEGSYRRPVALIPRAFSDILLPCCKSQRHQVCCARLKLRSWPVLSRHCTGHVFTCTCFREYRRLQPGVLVSCLIEPTDDLKLFVFHCSFFKRHYFRLLFAQ